MLSKEVTNIIWLTVSETAKIGGVQNKTIRRAIQQKIIKYNIINNRYFVDLSSAIVYLHSKTKLKNKFYFSGLGQYIKEWRE